MQPKHPLVDPKLPWVEMRFFYGDTYHTYQSGVSTLTEDRLSSFNLNPPMIDHSLAPMRTAVKFFLKHATDVTVRSNDNKINQMAKNHLTNSNPELK